MSHIASLLISILVIVGSCTGCVRSILHNDLHFTPSEKISDVLSSEAVLHAVVTVENLATNGGKGSGVLVPGGIITAAHMTSDTDQVRVTFKDGWRVKILEVSKRKFIYDIACIPFEIPEGYISLLPAEGRPVPGDEVIIVGHPEDYSWQPTLGVVTRAKRSIRYDNFRGVEVISIQGPSDGGNSGGAVLNENGKLVGILVAGAEVLGTSYAAPIDNAIKVCPELFESK